MRGPGGGRLALGGGSWALTPKPLTQRYRLRAPWRQSVGARAWQPPTPGPGEARRLLPFGGARRRAAERAAAAPTPRGRARRALVGSLGALLALSHTCTVAGQLDLSCNTSAARARMLFFFPSSSKSLPRSCRRIAFGFPPPRDHTPRAPLTPLSRPAVPGQLRLRCAVHSRGPGPRGRQAGRQGASGAFCGVHVFGKSFGNVILMGTGDFRLRQDGGSREDPEGGEGRAARSWASEQPWSGPGVGVGHGLCLASGFTYRLLFGVSQTLVSTSHLPSVSLICAPPALFFHFSFLLNIDLL